MRGILFRGKSLDNGEWAYGYVVAMPNTETVKILSHSRSYVAKSGIGQQEFCAHEVDPATVGQFTGLTDKNGKKIFEGDIVTQPVRETRKHSPCVIEFFNGCFKAHYLSEKRFFDRYYDINSFTKVIGNIHDNPELLGGAE